MKLVKANNQSRIRKLKIKELGRIANYGDVFSVTDERFKVLNGDNKFRVPFVTLVEDLPEQAESVDTEDLSELVKQTENEETPEIFVIEPGKEPVRVDENLKPIVEETPGPEEIVTEAASKKKTRKKKVVEETVGEHITEEKPKKKTRKVKEVSE